MTNVSPAGCALSGPVPGRMIQRMIAAMDCIPIGSLRLRLVFFRPRCSGKSGQTRSRCWHLKPSGYRDLPERISASVDRSYDRCYASAFPSFSFRSCLLSGSRRGFRLGHSVMTAWSRFSSIRRLAYPWVWATCFLVVIARAPVCYQSTI